MSPKPLQGIAVSGLATAYPSMMIALGKIFRKMGGTASAYSLRGQANYYRLAWSSWTETRAEALMQLQRIADRGTERGNRNVIFAHSLGAIAALLAAEQYTREQVATNIEGDEDGALDESIAPGQIDKFVAFNPCFTLAWHVWIAFLPCLLVLILFGNIPLIGHALKLIPVWKIRANTGSKEMSWLPLGAVYLIWRAMRDAKKLIEELETQGRKLPFEVTFFAGTDDFVCSHRYTRLVARRIGAAYFVPIPCGAHSPNLKDPNSTEDSEWEWKFAPLTRRQKPNSLHRLSEFHTCWHLGSY